MVVTNLSYTVALTISLFTTLLSVRKSAEPVFILSITILSTHAFKLAQPDFAAKFDVSTAAALFRSTFVA